MHDNVQGKLATVHYLGEKFSILNLFASVGGDFDYMSRRNDSKNGIILVQKLSE